ncbi:hypothetical protein V8B97DRAFT_1927267 [Scleroderma yunnanense]
MVLPPCDQYYDQLHPDQLSLNSRPPTSTQHDVQQQSDHPVRCTPTFTPQQDLASSTRLFDSSTSSPHNSLVHRSTPSLSKSSRSAPYPKAVQLDTSQTAQDESDASAIRAQRVLQAAPRKRPAARTQHRLSSDLPATPDPFIKPYACGHESCWPVNTSKSLACYSTSRGLSDHIKAEHLDDVGSGGPYRCGLEGCGKSWKSIDSLQYHIQISRAHFQHAFTNTCFTPYVDGLAIPASVEALMATRSETKKKWCPCPYENCQSECKEPTKFRQHLVDGHPSELPEQLDSVLLGPNRKSDKKPRAQAQAQGSAHPLQAPSSSLQHRQQHRRQ